MKTISEEYQFYKAPLFVPIVAKDDDGFYIFVRTGKGEGTQVSGKHHASKSLAQRELKNVRKEFYNAHSKMVAGAQ